MTPRERVLLTLLFLAVPFTACADGEVNINTADIDMLMTLSGIGAVKAQAIIDYRETNGPFKTKEDIQNVSGIGDATYNNIKDHIVVQGGISVSPSAPAPSPSGSPTPSPSPASSSSTDASKESKESEESLSGLTVSAGTDRTLVAGADAMFKARGYNKKKETFTNLRFRWNFGDGATGEGGTILHAYEYPGRYVVVLTALEDESASDEIMVTVEEMQLKLTTLPDGGVAIENPAKKDIDISNWAVRDGKTLVMSPNTIILAGQTLRISPKTLGFNASVAAKLIYPSGALAASVTVPASVATTTEISPPPEKPARASVTKKAVVSKTAEEPEETTTKAAVETVSATSQVAAAAANSGPFSWWMGAITIAFFGSGAVYAARRFKRREWDIIDET